MNKRIIFASIFVIFCAAVFALSLRGLPGNPTADELNSPRWKENGPLELSPERGRFALAYSAVEDKSLQFSLPIARFATPDLGLANGRYVSLFAPGVSFLIIPGYIIGKHFGATQIGAFAVISFFAVLNGLLIWFTARHLGAHFLAAGLGSLAFLFATPAFAYGVTLYQHHISSFLILLSAYILIRWNNLWSLSLIWFLAALSVAVDNPNAILMASVVLYALGRMVIVRKDGESIKINLRLIGILTFLAAVLPLAFFLWFNQASHGDALKLSGTLPSVPAIDEAGNPKPPAMLESIQARIPQTEEQPQKTVIGFFQTRNLLNGFYIHFFSPDRGMIFFAPIIFFGIFGLMILYRKNHWTIGLFAAIVGANVLLYSMWGDPWGGWAFGSRYLIPSYAILSIGVGLILTKERVNYLFLAFFAIVFGYSVWVNALGAITSSANPPQVEIADLENLTGRIEKYSFDRNLQFLDSNNSKSIVFQAYAGKYMNVRQYHWLLWTLIFGAALAMLAGLGFKNFKKRL